YSLLYGDNALLQYGNSDQTTQQTTTDAEWPGAGGPNNVTIYNSGNVSLHASRTINGNLSVINGNFITGENILTLGTNSSLTESAGKTVVGNIQTTREVLRGVNNTFGGIGLEINPAGTAPGNTAILRKTGTATTGNSSEGIKRYFQITPTETSGFNATLVFKYDENELNAIPEGNLVLFRSTDLSNWDQVPAVLNTSNNTLTATGVNNFSYWTAGNSSTPLPVELSGFSVRVTGKKVELRWKTENEVNSFMFEIQRAGAESLWEKIGEVKAGGNSNSPKEYYFRDGNLSNGKYQYRLRMVDIDGTYQYSDAVEVKIDKPEKFAISQNYPNPFNPSTTIEYEIPERSHISLKIFDVLGNEVETPVNGIKDAGYHKVNYHSGNTNISSGTYFYRINITELESGKTFSETKKMQLIK
ncbi:MAG: T9SS type A sorting domain-containing protein, partial [Ignavibacteriales bacterium]|nr:T9SS type A sorting domain-containing protein [Ignavibacteriales bacterium]